MLQFIQLHAIVHFFSIPFSAPVVYDLPRGHRAHRPAAPPIEAALHAHGAHRGGRRRVRGRRVVRLGEDPVVLHLHWLGDR